ncbi:MAG: AAA family ATPase [Desulforhopalus sp.]|jgi:chromosome partitioning protein|nr:AAA family ATPase [Desulforhopalus sp.]
MKKIISVINQKGGVGKTTTSTNLSCGLALAGYRVLLIDLDPQGHSTIGMGMADHCEYFVQDILINGKKISDVVCKTPTENLDIVASNIHLSKATNTLFNEHFREMRLNNALLKEADNYDFVVIDCHPSLGILEINALYACNFILVPTDTGRYSLEGFADLIDTIRSIMGPDEDIRDYLRILVTIFDSREKGINDWVDEQLAEFSEIVLSTKIRKITGIKQAQIAEQPIMIYDGKSPGTEDYNKLTQELLSIW